MTRWFLIAMIFVLTSACVSTKANVRKTVSGYHPYEGIAVTDENLYNTAFNLVQKDLVYLVDNSMTYEPSITGVFFEIKPPYRFRTIEDTFSGKALRAWQMESGEVVPLSDEEIDGFNHGDMPSAYKGSPIARYAIFAADTENATVYARLWVPPFANYDMTYQLTRKNDEWITTKKTQN
jgi:hypothetical protein